MRSSHGGDGFGDYAINSAREALPEGGRGRGDVREAVGETERGEMRRRARGGSTELPVAMEERWLRCFGASDERRSKGGGRTRAEGSKALSISSQPVRGMVRASKACGGHAAAVFCCRSAMTGLKFLIQQPNEPTDRRYLVVINF